MADDQQIPFDDECFHGEFAAPVPVDTLPLGADETARFLDLVEETRLLDVEEKFQAAAEERAPIRRIRKALAAIRLIGQAASRAETPPADQIRILREDAFVAAKLRREMRQTWKEDDTESHPIHHWFDALLRLAATITGPGIAKDDAATLGATLLFLHDTVVAEGAFELHFVGHNACDDGRQYDDVVYPRYAALQRALVALGAPRPYKKSEDRWGESWENELPVIGWGIHSDESKRLWSSP